MNDPSSIQSTFELWLGQDAATVLRVASFRGREGMSMLSSFDVTAIAPSDEDLGDEALLGSPAALVAQDPVGPSRLIDGVVAAVRPSAARSLQDRRSYRVRLAPALWMLKWRVKSRIFQNLSVPEIVGKVLAGAGVPYTSELSRPYPARAYCVQYRESDYDFIRRVLAEEGISYSFERQPAAPGGGRGLSPDPMILSDSEQFYPFISGPDGAPTPSTPVLHHREFDGGSPRDDEISRFEVRRIVRPRRLLLRDYDFRSPSLDLRSRAEADAAVPAPPEGGGSDLGELHVYRHRGEYEEPEISATRASIDLEQQRRRAVIGRGDSVCRRLAPGHRFRLDAGSALDLSGEYVVTRVDHEGHAPGFDGAGTGAKEVYKNRFECAPASRAYRPRRPKRSPFQVCETATVVGPSGEDVHTDSFGRIKVQFHWDLDGKRDESSSAWIRVAQGWAGTGWGLQFIPRIGMEVLVTFLGGDVDCPVVTGCLANAAHPPAFVLPREKTRSGIRTNSTPGGGGFNEVSFEDSSGGEVIRLHAQRNWDSVVRHDHTRSVGHDEQIRIGGSREVAIAGELSELVGGSSTETVEGDRTTVVGGSADHTVRGSGDIRFAGDLTTIVGGRERRTVSGQAEIVLEDDALVRALGATAVIVGHHDAPRSLALHVEGTAQLSSTQLTEVSSETAISLRCGSSSIRITPESISISAKTVSVNGGESTVLASQDRMTLWSKTKATVEAESMLLRSDGASVALSSTARINGDKVKLKSGHDPAEDGPVVEPPKPTLIEVVNPDGAPIPRQRFIVVQESSSPASRTRPARRRSSSRAARRRSCCPT
jgi:type VI secretion system secreted protein VgrG